MKIANRDKIVFKKHTIVAHLYKYFSEYRSKIGFDPMDTLWYIKRNKQ